jgi:hypothetical protein
MPNLNIAPNGILALRPKNLEWDSLVSPTPPSFINIPPKTRCFLTSHHGRPVKNLSNPFGTKRKVLGKGWLSREGFLPKVRKLFKAQFSAAPETPLAFIIPNSHPPQSTASNLIYFQASKGKPPNVKVGPSL